MEVVRPFSVVVVLFLLFLDGLRLWTFSIRFSIPLLTWQPHSVFGVEPVCGVFLCIQTVIWLPMLGIFDVRRNANACDYTRELYEHHKRVCTKSWLWRKNFLPHRGVKPAPAARRIRRSNNWATSPPPPQVWRVSFSAQESTILSLLPR